MYNLSNKHILVGITGGIAAYKSAELVRRLRDCNAHVRVVMSDAATQFITPLTLQAVSGQPVHQHLLDAESESGMGHIDLARWADVVLVAPATADFIARAAQGMANDLLSAICLATTAKIVIAPAMNQQMWNNSITQDNLTKLNKHGITLLGPASGDQACGEVGMGRMLEPMQIVDGISRLFISRQLEGTSVVVTAGPTWEAIDPVRGITNHSSGKMGYAIGNAAVDAGAQVTLIAGPTKLPDPERIHTVKVTSAQEMFDAVHANIKGADIFIGVAAVADYRPASNANKKIKKQDHATNIELVPNPDILQSVAALPNPPYTVGFAAETDDMEVHARKKLEKKKLNLIAANNVNDKNSGFDSDQNALVLIDKTESVDLPLTTKNNLAIQLIEEIAKRYHAENTIKNT